MVLYSLTESKSAARMSYLRTLRFLLISYGVIKFYDKNIGNTSSNSNQNEGEIIGQLWNTLAKNHILLIFDNVNKVLETDETGFSSIIEKLHSVCDQSRILISSDKEISHLKSIDKAVFELIHLPLQQGIKLLIDKCTRKIDNKEIAELIKSEANCKNLLEHPFSKYLGGYPKKIVEAAEALKTQTLVEYYNQIKLN